MNEAWSFLSHGRKSLAVATVNPDGRAHLTVVWFVVVDGRLAFWTYRKSQRARNIDRNANVTCLAHAGESYSDLVGVMIVGQAELNRGPRSFEGGCRRGLSALHGRTGRCRAVFDHAPTSEACRSPRGTRINRVLG